MHIQQAHLATRSIVLYVREVLKIYVIKADQSGCERIPVALGSVSKMLYFEQYTPKRRMK